MHSAGRIAEIWRYPISSVGGELVSRADLQRSGLVGDRQFGLIDAATGDPAVPEKDVRWRKALHLIAAYGQCEIPVISFPGGRRYCLDDPSLNRVLTQYFDFEVKIAAYEHTKLRLGFPLTQFRHQHFPLHLLTTSSVERLAALRGTSAIHSKRFRPNVLIEAIEGEGFVESNWIGRCLRFAGVQLKAEEDTKRCGVTFISQPGFGDDPEILRTILRHNKRNLGIYCSIEQAGAIAIGDQLFVVP